MLFCWKPNETIRYKVEKSQVRHESANSAIIQMCRDLAGRLLRANSITFQWQRLASWVNLTEKWPYRTSRLAVYYRGHEDAFDDELPLKALFERFGRFSHSHISFLTLCTQ